MRFHAVKSRHARQRMRALAGALALMVLGSVAQGGTRYVYCRAMDTVLTHACCAKKQPTRSPAVSKTDACCQAHEVAQLAPFTQLARAQEAPALVALPVPGELRVPAPMRCSHAGSACMRTGPPAGPPRARSMVFLI